MGRGASIALALGFAGAAAADTNIPIFVHIVSHNEEASAYDTNALLFERERTQVVAFARMLYTNGVKYDWQSDWRYLAGMTNFDRLGHADTGGTNLAAWLQQHLGFSVDPHAHETTRSYADVVHLYRLNGVEPSGVVGGFIAGPPASSIYDRVSTVITGYVYPSVTWQPRILWGGGSGLHRDETNLWCSGVRLPRGRDHFMEHSPSGRLPCVGHYGNRDVRWTNLARLIEFRAQGRLCSNRMYTCLIMCNQPELTAPFVASFEATLQQFKTNANLRWVTIPEIVEAWSNEFGAAPNVFPYAYHYDADEDGLDDGWEVTNFCDLAWSDGGGDADGDGQTDLGEYVAGTAATDPGSFLALTGAGGGAPAVLAWTGVTGRFYTAQSAPGPDGPWLTNLVLPGRDGTMTFTNAAPGPWYRIGALR